MRGLVALLVIVLSACSGIPGVSPSGADPTPEPEPLPTEQVTPEPGSPRDGGPREEPTEEVLPQQETPGPDDRGATSTRETGTRTVTVALGGDVHGESAVDRLLEAGGNPLSGLRSTLTAADLTIVNLETAVGSSGSPAPKQYTFQARPDLLSALAEGGVDVVSVANNHSLDYGVEGLLETLDAAAEAGLATVGGGADAAQAYAPHYVDAREQTIAVIGLTRVIPEPDWAATEQRGGVASVYEPWLPNAVAAVEEAAARADRVVVMVHWGQEGATCPDDVQTTVARHLVDAGADVVAGHHPHVLQGIQTLDGAIVAYSLGNFVWYAAAEAGRNTAVLNAHLPPDRAARWELVPARIDDTGTPRPLAEEDPGSAEAIAQDVADRSPGGEACAHVDWPT